MQSDFQFVLDLTKSPTFWTAVGSIAAVTLVLLEIERRFKFLRKSARRRRKIRPIQNSEVGYELVDSIEPLRGHRFVFCYGSLLIPESLIRTLMRTEGSVKYMPMSLKNRRLAWGVPSIRRDLVDRDFRTFSKGRPWLSFITVPDRQANAKVHGAIIQVSENEFSELALREANYAPHRLDRSELESPSGAKAPNDVYFFDPRAKKSEDSQDEAQSRGFAVRKEYLEGVRQMLDEFGFDEITMPGLPPSTEVIDAFKPDELLTRTLRSRRIRLDRFNDRLYDRLDDFPGMEQIHRINTGTRPLLFSSEVFEQVRRQAETVVSLCARALDGMLADSEFLERAKIRDVDVTTARSSDEKNPSMPAIARVDLTLFKEQVHVFEVNADSPGGMFHIDFLNHEHGGLLFEQTTGAERGRFQEKQADL